MREGELDLSHGRLCDHSLAAVLMAARSREATGVLCIEAAGGTSRLWLRRGVPAGAQMGFGFRPLGQILVLHGLIDLEALDRAAPRLDRGEPLERVLLDMGALDARGLEEGRRLQQREHLRILCRLAEGHFAFESQDLPSWTEGLDLNADWSLVEALAAPPAEEFTLKLLADIGARLLRLNERFSEVAPLLRLSQPERQGLESWRDGGTVEDLLKARVEPKRARWLAAALLALGSASAVDPVAEAREQAERVAHQAEEQLRLAAEEHARRLEEARAHAADKQHQDGLRARLAEAEAARAEAARREAEEAAAARALEAQAATLLQQASEARAHVTEQVRAIAVETRERLEQAQRESERLREEAESAEEAYGLGPKAQGASPAAEESIAIAEAAPAAVEEQAADGEAGEAYGLRPKAQGASPAAEESIAIDEAASAPVEEPATVAEASPAAEDSIAIAEAASAPVEEPITVVASPAAEDSIAIAEAASAPVEEPIAVAEAASAAVEEPITAAEASSAAEESTAIAEASSAAVEEPVAATEASFAAEESTAIAEASSAAVEEQIAVAAASPATEDSLAIAEAEPSVAIEEPTAFAEALPAVEASLAIAEAPAAAVEVPLAVDDALSSPAEAPPAIADALSSAVEDPFSIAEAISAAVEKPIAIADAASAAVEEPIAIADAPYAAVQGPLAIADAPSTAVEEPFSIADAISAAVEEPFVVADAPSAAVEGSLALADASSAAVEEPLAIAAASSATVEEPLAIADAPLAAVEEPLTIADAPLAAVEEPLAIADAPLAAVEEPLAIAAAPSATVEEPLAIAAASSATVEEPLAIADAPSAAVEDPLVLGDAPSAAVEEPLALGDAPSAAVEEPLAVADASSAAVEAPLAIADASSSAVEEPLAFADASSAAVEAPLAIADAPSAAVEEPLALDASFVAAEEPLAIADAPSAVVEEPLAIADALSAVVEEPLAIADALSAAVEEPLALDASFAAAEEPLALADVPSAAVELPLAIADAPSAAVELPLGVAVAPSAAVEEPLAAAVEALAIAAAEPEAPAQLEATPFEGSAAALAPAEGTFIELEASAEIPSFEESNSASSPSSEPVSPSPESLAQGSSVLELAAAEAIPTPSHDDPPAPPSLPVAEGWVAASTSASAPATPSAASTQSAVAEELMTLLAARERAEEKRQAQLREAHTRASKLQVAEGTAEALAAAGSGTLEPSVASPALAAAPAPVTSIPQPPDEGDAISLELEAPPAEPATPEPAAPEPAAPEPAAPEPAPLAAPAEELSLAGMEEEPPAAAPVALNLEGQDWLSAFDGQASAPAASAAAELGSDLFNDLGPGAGPLGEAPLRFEQAPATPVPDLAPDGAEPAPLSTADAPAPTPAAETPPVPSAAPTAVPVSSYLDDAMSLVEDMTIPDELGFEDLYGSSVLGRASGTSAAPAPAAVPKPIAEAPTPIAPAPSVPSASPVSEYLDHAMALVEDLSMPDQLGIDDLFGSRAGASHLASQAPGGPSSPAAAPAQPTAASTPDQGGDIATAVESLAIEVPDAEPELTLDSSQFAAPPEPTLDLSTPPEPNLLGSDLVADIDVAMDEETHSPSSSAPASTGAGSSWMQAPEEAAPAFATAPALSPESPHQPSTPELHAAPDPLQASSSSAAAPSGLHSGTPPLDLGLASAGSEALDVADSDDARIRRQRLLKRAFNNLGVPQRAEHAGAEPQATQPRAIPPIPSVPAVPPPAAAPAAPTGPALSKDDETLAKAITEKSALVAKKDYFGLLGVPRSATRDQLKAAYLSSVKTFHPDRLPPSLGHLAAAAKDVFSGIREAHETLQDEGRRKAYLAAQQAGASSPPQATNEKGAEWAAQADLAIKKREYARGAELYGRAFGVTKLPAHLAQQAWAIYLDPDRKQELPLVKSKLEEALKLDPRCDRACYCLGVIARVENDLDRAERLFKQATDSNPRNAEAATELRLLQMRKKRKG